MAYCSRQNDGTRRLEPYGWIDEVTKLRHGQVFGRLTRRHDSHLAGEMDEGVANGQQFAAVDVLHSVPLDAQLGDAVRALRVTLPRAVDGFNVTVAVAAPPYLVRYQLQNVVVTLPVGARRAYHQAAMVLEG